MISTGHLQNSAAVRFFFRRQSRMTFFVALGKVLGPNLNCDTNKTQTEMKNHTMEWLRLETTKTSPTVMGSLGTRFFRRGHPQSAVFSLFSYTCTDSFCLAHLQWLCNYCATIDNSCLASLQWLNKTKKQEKMTIPNSLPLLPALGCAIFFWFHVFWFVVCFFWRAGKTTQKWRIWLFASSPTLRVANLLLVVLLFALGLWSH